MLGICYSVIYTSNHRVTYSPILLTRKVRHKKIRETDSSFPGSSAGKESTCNAGDLGSIPVLGRSPGEGKGYPLQYSGLENSRTVSTMGVTKSLTGPSDFHFQR